MLGDISMGITAIKQFNNQSADTVIVRNVERAQFWELSRGLPRAVDIWIPWCVSQVDFNNNHYMMIEFRQPVRTYWIWQSNEGDLDRVRYTPEGRWKPGAASVPGYAYVDGNRSVELRKDGTIFFSQLAS
jgi:hypothetical protein